MKLEKILYLADLEHFHRTGSSITGTEWVRHRLGPIAKAVPVQTRAMKDREVVVTEEPVFGHTSTVYRPGPSPRFTPDLPAPEQASIDRVLLLVKSLNAAEAAKLAYETTPMLARLQVEAKAGHALWDVPLVFDRSPEAVARVSVRQPKATAERRRTFKRAERARVDDLVKASIAQS
jgi:hypothetical protein